EGVGLRRLARRRRSTRHELRTGTEAQHGRPWALMRLDGHAEERLVEVDRALRVADGNRHVIERANLELGWRLREQPARHAQRRKRQQQIAAGQLELSTHDESLRSRDGLKAAPPNKGVPRAYR